MLTRLEAMLMGCSRQQQARWMGLDLKSWRPGRAVADWCPPVCNIPNALLSVAKNNPNGDF